MSRSNYFKLLRIAHLAQLCDTVGRFNRRDLADKFQISIPQASVDIREFLRARPDVVYDCSGKCYRVVAKAEGSSVAPDSRNWGSDNG